MCFNRGSAAIAALSVCSFLCSGLQADELILKDGSRLFGKLVSAQEQSVVFSTGFAGKLTISADSIESFSTTEPVTLMLEDGTVVRNELISGKGDDGIRVSTASAPNNVLVVNSINPEPWELGNGYEWSGKAFTTLEFERGNSSTDEWQLDGEGEWLSVRDRITTKIHWQQEESNGEKVNDQWRVEGNYDYFLANPDHYIGAHLMFEADKFSDLDLRSQLGILFGRQFSSRPRLAVRGSLGIAYVDEQFDIAEDNDYFASTWQLQADSNILGGERELYLRHDGSLDVTNSDSLILNTALGVSVPVVGGFQVAAEIRYEYDGAAPEGIDDLDKTLNFRLGYSW